MTPENHPGLDELILYSMGTPDAASDRVEMDRVRLHMKKCAECRAKVAEMRTDMALAAMTVPQFAPPAAAKERLFQAAGLNLSQAVKAAASPSSAATNRPEGTVVPMKPRRTSPGLLWGGWLAAAACLLYAVQIRNANQGMRRQLRTETAEIIQSHTSAAQLRDANRGMREQLQTKTSELAQAHTSAAQLHGANQGMREQLQTKTSELAQAHTSAARAQEVLDVLSSPQAQHITLVSAHAKPVPTGHAVYLASRGALVFTASNLAPLPANKTYELWVIPANGTAPVSAGTFQPDARGMASVLLPNLPRGIQAKAFGVTMENSGGSATPTLPILLAGG